MNAVNTAQDAVNGLLATHFPEPEPVVTHTYQPTGLTDDEVMEWVFFRDPNAAKFRKLRDGDTSDYGGDDSSADMALVTKLYFYSGDVKQVHRVMHTTALKREKWEIMRRGVDYLMYTIQNAAKGTTEVFTPTKDTSGATARPRGLGGRVLLGKAIEEGIEPPEELIPDVLLASKVHQVYAAAGTGKTFFALWAVAEVLKQGKPVLYLDMENGERTIGERLSKWGLDSHTLDSLLHYHPEPELDLSPESVKSYVATLEDMQPALVVFDSWINYIARAGLDENVSGDIAKWSVQYTHPAKARGTAVVLLDHVPKEGNGARGSGRKRDEVDVQWKLSNPVPFDRDTTGSVKLHRDKDREGWLPQGVSFSVGGEPGGKFVFERVGANEESHGKLNVSHKKVLDTLEEVSRGDETFDGITTSNFQAKAHEYHGVSRATFYRALGELRTAKRIETRNGRHFLASESGQSHEVSQGSHEEMRLAQEGLTGLTPLLRGEPETLVDTERVDSDEATPITEQEWTEVF